MTRSRIARVGIKKTKLNRSFSSQLDAIPMTTEQKHRAAGTAEGRRLIENQGQALGWRRWGPYVSERSWGTVREDYSADGSAWNFLPHEHARHKAYRWGEDGLAGICDRYQLLVFSLAMWNGRDPILKERAFGLTPQEGNHGEDVKEYYFYLDSTPTHSYMKYLYKYPHARYPYEWLAEENSRRGGQGMEFELLDTGIFNEDRYFDVFVEYAKASAEDLCIRIEAINRGPEAAELHLIPQLWFRNTWGWTNPRGTEPLIFTGPPEDGVIALAADDSTSDPLPNLPFEYRLGRRYLYGEAGGQALFTDNETNKAAAYGVSNDRPYGKDAFHRAVIHGEHDAVNPESQGTKACIDYRRIVGPGESFTLRLRLTAVPMRAPLSDVDSIVAKRREECDEFYAVIHPPKATEDE